MASVCYNLYLNTSVTPDVLRCWLVEEHDFELSATWYSEDGIPVLIKERCLVWVRPPDPDLGGPYDYKQAQTMFVTLDPNKQSTGQEFLCRVLGDILQHCPGDATVEYDVGGTLVLRRGKTVWIHSEPFTREHLFAGDFRPAKLVIGLPQPDPHVDTVLQPHTFSEK